MKIKDGRYSIIIGIVLTYYVYRKPTARMTLRNVGGMSGGGLYFFDNGTNLARGVAILIKRNVPIMVEDCEKSGSGRIISCNIRSINSSQNKISIINIYAPNDDSPSFFTEVELFVRKAQSHKIVVGDFNLTLCPDLDRINSIERHPNSVKKIKTIMTEWDLVDLWRIRNPGVKRFTWDKSKPTFIASRIDNTLVSEGLTTLVEKYYPYYWD